jgi:hypothetical protein
MIAEARKQNLLVLRDYAIETDQLDHTIGYNTDSAHKYQVALEKAYNKLG